MTTITLKITTKEQEKFMVSPEFQTTYQNLCQLSSSILQICDEKKKIDLKNGYGIQRLQDIILNLKKIK